jgi:hypothetical protein
MEMGGEHTAEKVPLLCAMVVFVVVLIVLCKVEKSNELLQRGVKVSKHHSSHTTLFDTQGGAQNQEPNKRREKGRADNKCFGGRETSGNPKRLVW